MTNGTTELRPQQEKLPPLCAGHCAPLPWVIPQPTWPLCSKDSSPLDLLPHLLPRIPLPKPPASPICSHHPLETQGLAIPWSPLTSLASQTTQPISFQFGFML